MTRDEVVAILMKATYDWRDSLDDPRTGFEWQADALIAAQQAEDDDLTALMTSRYKPRGSDEATIADLKARQVLRYSLISIPTLGSGGDEPLYRVVLPGPAMEDEQ